MTTKEQVFLSYDSITFIDIWLSIDLIKCVENPFLHTKPTSQRSIYPQRRKHGVTPVKLAREYSVSITSKSSIYKYIRTNMEYIANAINGKYLRDVLPKGSAEIDGVLAAIAYGGTCEAHFLENCLNHQYRLDIWMRYDHTIPVKIPLLKKFLKLTSKNIFCYQVPDILHSKVIWWKGYGAYIGSANLSDRAWNSNIEAGLFLDDIELHEAGMHLELDNFFNSLLTNENTFPLTKEIVDELDQINELRRDKVNSLDFKSKGKRSVQPWEGLKHHSKKTGYERSKEAFRTEWHDTLTILRAIGDEVVKYQPIWVKGSLPPAWQADQFLHAYYYQKVKEGRKHPYEMFYQKNVIDPASALREALIWWGNLEEAPSFEEDTLYRTAPYIQEKLDRNNILNLTLDEFEKVCSFTHATKDHVLKISLSKMGEFSQVSADQETRLKMYAKWIWEKHNLQGMKVNDVLHHVLYGGPDVEVWSRLYEATHNPRYSLPHYGLNSISEVVGWVIPNILPPRNGRTNKALRALGYTVRVYSS